MTEEYNYGLCPPGNTYALDQVPLEFADATQSHNDVGAGECFIRGSKIDMSKRQASLQVVVRAINPQTTKPAIVFRAVPKMTMTPDGEVKVDPRQASRLKEFDMYDPGVRIQSTRQERSHFKLLLQLLHKQVFVNTTKLVSKFS